jgi:hypothetical protein
VCERENDGQRCVFWLAHKQRSERSKNAPTRDAAPQQLAMTCELEDSNIDI